MQTDSIDRLLDALDKCRDARNELGIPIKAKADLRAAVVAVVVEDFQNNGSLRQMLLKEATPETDSRGR